MIKDIKKKLENNKPLKFLYKTFKVITTIILVLFLIVILVQRFSNNNIAINGVRVFCVVSESMKPEYEIGDILITSKVDASELKVGDNVTY